MRSPLLMWSPRSPHGSVTNQIILRSKHHVMQQMQQSEHLIYTDIASLPAFAAKSCIFDK
ncbi:hypothetical protein MTBSS4_350032 [Magnetospirillum sp. SS-4]|nr:hypothetical protein MTBSS4_350032 [Magnetospirillum sp. SS-4]